MIDALLHREHSSYREIGQRAVACTKAAGMHTAFIDRRKCPFGATPHQPDVWLDDMKLLADVMV